MRSLCRPLSRPIAIPQLPTAPLPHTESTKSDFVNGLLGMINPRVKRAVRGRLSLPLHIPRVPACLCITRHPPAGLQTDVDSSHHAFARSTAVATGEPPWIGPLPFKARRPPPVLLTAQVR